MSLLAYIGALYVVFISFAVVTLWSAYGRLSVKWLFEPRDFWVGAYWEPKTAKLYILALPVFGGVVLTFPTHEPNL